MLAMFQKNTSYSAHFLISHCVFHMIIEFPGSTQSQFNLAFFSDAEKVERSFPK
jgi:hypothetical protein